MRLLMKLSALALCLRLTTVGLAATSTGLVTSCTTLAPPPPVGQVPPTPSALTFPASNISSNSILATWTPGAQTSNTSTATVFFLQISVADQSHWATYSSNNVSVIGVTVTNLPASTEIFGRVIAWDGKGNGI